VYGTENLAHGVSFEKRKELTTLVLRALAREELLPLGYRVISITRS
jgi:hypothetical protein